MWKTHIEQVDAGRTRKISILGDGKPLLYSDIVDKWQHDEGFRTFFLSLLADTPFPAYFWETPPVTAGTVGQRFEFVLVDSPLLANIYPDPSAFECYFESNADDGIVTFPNLGGDALLVAPCPLGPLSVYPHIAAFVRGAPESQKHALWRCVGAALAQRLHERPIWLSTAGQGVSWVHVRLDSRPKYYSYRPYTEVTR